MTKRAYGRVIFAGSLVLALGCAVAGPAAVAQSYDATTVANLTLQVSQLQEQLRMLARQVEETNQQLRALQQQMQQMQNDGGSNTQGQRGRSGALPQPAQGSLSAAQGGGLVTGSVGAPGQSGATLRTMPQLPSYGAEGGIEQLASAAVQDPSLDPARMRYAQAGGSSQRATGPQVLGHVPVDPSETRAGAVPEGYGGQAQYSGQQGYGAYSGQQGSGGPVDLTTGLNSSYGGGSLLPEAVERTPLAGDGGAPANAGQPIADGSGAPPAGSSQGVAKVPAEGSGAALASLPATGGGPDLLYERSFDAYANKRYAEAQSGFQSFLDTYAGNELAGNAQYWLGQIYFEQGDFKQAANAYLKGYQGYKKSRRAPDSLIGLALTLDKLDQKAKACTAFDQVARAFPSAKESIKRATEESKKVGCS